MPTVADLDFGDDVAEFDLNLASYFIETDIYKRIVAGKTFLVTGRKGAGKTALLTYAEKRPPAGTLVLKVEASHTTYVRIQQSVEEVNGDLATLDTSFKHAWLFSTLMALADHVTKEPRLALDRDAQLVHRFAREHLNYVESDKISAIGNYVVDWFLNAKKVSIPTIVEFEREVGRGMSRLVFDEHHIMRGIKSAVSTIKKAGPGQVLLFFDKLDERWDGGPIYIAFLQGLLLAIRELRAANVDLRPVVLLRDDIYRKVTETFQHVDHFRNATERIRWDEDQLVDLLAARIRESLRSGGYPLHRQMNSQELWELAFVPTLPDRRPYPSTAYLVDRTLARPRDIILLANHARRQARSDASVIGVEDIRAAEQKYSEEKYDDLVAELSTEFPGNRDIFEHFRGLTFGRTMADLKALCGTIIDAEHTKHDWLPSTDRALIEWLYEVGFLSYTVQGGALRGTRVVHSGVNDNPKELFKKGKVYVSPIFRKGLEMRDRARRQNKKS